MIDKWKKEIEAGKTHAQLTINEKMCTIRVMVKEQQAKRPMAFFTNFGINLGKSQLSRLIYIEVRTSVSTVCLFSC